MALILVFRTVVKIEFRTPGHFWESFVITFKIIVEWSESLPGDESSRSAIRRLEDYWRRVARKQDIEAFGHP